MNKRSLIILLTIFVTLLGCKMRGNESGVREAYVSNEGKTLLYWVVFQKDANYVCRGGCNEQFEPNKNNMTAGARIGVCSENVQMVPTSAFPTDKASQNVLLVVQGKFKNRAGDTLFEYPYESTQREILDLAFKNAAMSQMSAEEQGPAGTIDPAAPIGVIDPTAPTIKEICFGNAQKAPATVSVAAPVVPSDPASSSGYTIEGNDGVKNPIPETPTMQQRKRCKTWEKKYRRARSTDSRGADGDEWVDVCVEWVYY